MTLDALRSASLSALDCAGPGPDDAGARYETRASSADHGPHLADRFTLIDPSNADRLDCTVGRRPKAGQSGFHILLLPGDELGADALAGTGGGQGQAFWIGICCMLTKSASARSARTIEPFFKPDFSLDLLLSTNYIGRPWVVTGALLARDRRHPGQPDRAWRIRSGAPLLRTGRRHHSCAEAAVSAAGAWTWIRRPGTGRAGTRVAAARHCRGRCWRRRFRHLAGQADGAAVGQGFDHHSDLRRAWLYRNLHQQPAREDRLSRLRDRLHRQHSSDRTWRGRSGCSKMPTRLSKFRMPSTGRSSTTARRRSLTANSCCS